MSDEDVKKKVAHALLSMAAILHHCRSLSNEGRGQSGAIDCPVCGSVQTLTWSRAESNGHIWAKCRTAECVSFIQ